MLRYKTETRTGLVALYDIRPGNGAGPFLQPRSPHGAVTHVTRDSDTSLKVQCSQGAWGHIVAASRTACLICFYSLL